MRSPAREGQESPVGFSRFSGCSTQNKREAGGARVRYCFRQGTVEERFRSSNEVGRTARSEGRTKMQEKLRGICPPWPSIAASRLLRNEMVECILGGKPV